MPSVTGGGGKGGEGDHRQGVCCDAAFLTRLLLYSFNSTIELYNGSPADSEHTYAQGIFQTDNAR